MCVRGQEQLNLNEVRKVQRNDEDVRDALGLKVYRKNFNFELT